MRTGVPIERPIRMIEPIQIKMIHTAIAKLGLSDDDYRTILLGHYQKASCTALTYTEAHNLLEYFKTLGFTIKRRTKERGYSRRVRHLHLKDKVVFLPTIQQMNLIEVLVKKVDWCYADGYERWRRKYMKIDRITTTEEASTVIEGLKGLIVHQKGEHAL